MALAHDEVIINGEIRKIDYFIESKDNYIRPTDSKYADWFVPGNILAITGGTRVQIKFIDMKGTSSNPIYIVNKGKVVIESTMYGIAFAGCEHIKLLGNADPDINDKYGIEVARTGDGAMGVDVGSYSTNFEIAGLEIHNTGFCGIMAKTNGAIGWTLYDLHIHDNYIHDTHGEGMYIGETKTPSHELKGVKVHNNLVVGTGWDLWQIANVTEDVEVYNNTFWDGGKNNELYQNKGLQIGNWSVGKYYNNVIGRTRSNFAIVMPMGDVEIYNTYFDGADTIDDYGIFSDDRSMSSANLKISYKDNWFRSFKNAVFLMYNNVNTSVIEDNIWDPAGNTADFIRYGGGASESDVILNNNIQQTIEQIEFNDDFTIKEGTFFAGKGIGYAPAEMIPDPPEVHNLVAAPKSTHEIELVWNVSESASVNPYGVRIERKDPGVLEFVQIHETEILNNDFLTFIDSSLNDNSTYTYRVRTYNAAKVSPYSNEASATTNEILVPPNAPTDLNAEAVSAHQVNLTWFDASDNETGFIVERSEIINSGFIQITSVGAGVTFVADADVEANKTYYYRVKATSAAGDSGYSNTAEVTTPEESAPPTKPVTVKFTYGLYYVYKGDFKGLVGQVPVEDGDTVVKDKVITNKEEISSHNTLSDALNTASIQKLRNAEKFIWVAPDPIETTIIEV